MKPAPAFPSILPLDPVLAELARAIRFFLGAKKELLPAAAGQAFDWEEIDLPAEPHRGGVPLTKLLNGPESGGEPWLKWRQDTGEDPLALLLSIAADFGASAVLRRLWDTPGWTLDSLPRATVRALGQKLVDTADFMDRMDHPETRVAE